MSIKREDILNEFPDEQFLFADGFDDAIIGVDDRDMRIIYSMKKILEILMKDSMSYDDAQEYYDFNILGSYVGEKTPIYMFDLF